MLTSIPMNGAFFVKKQKKLAIKNRKKEGRKRFMKKGEKGQPLLRQK